MNMYTIFIEHTVGGIEGIAVETSLVKGVSI